MKPAFVVIAAWLFAENDRRPEIPGNLFSIVIFMIAVALLVAQPDIGQTVLLAMVWSGLFFMAGMPIFWIFLLMGLGVGGLTMAYFFVPHVTGRINRFLDPASGDTFQVDTAMDAIIRGGWLGVGPGEGTGQAHIARLTYGTFIFAVLAEEFGIIACMVLISVYLFIVVRALRLALQTQDLFKRLAISGLALFVRTSGRDQYRREPEADARQGHDVAFHFLWWLVASLGCPHYGAAFGPDAQAARSRAGKTAVFQTLRLRSPFSKLTDFADRTYAEDRVRSRHPALTELPQKLPLYSGMQGATRGWMSE